ncbi:MAG: hypothetical protein JXQ75_14340 [Phycisphaerae bacterium]|nr:hypothetical protein [Phycisphaerae bacterium]
MLSITVHLIAGLSVLRPVTGGVPIAEGAAPAGSVFVLRDERGGGVPLQTSVLAKWKDGSARWILLDFAAGPLGGELKAASSRRTPHEERTRRYTLSWEKPKKPGTTLDGGITISNDDPRLRAQAMKIRAVGDSVLRVGDRLDVACSLTDGSGQHCPAQFEHVKGVSSATLHPMVLVTGAFETPSGQRMFQFRMQVSSYAGTSLVRFEPMIVIDAEKGIMRHIRDLSLTFRPVDEMKAAVLGGEPGWRGQATTPVRLLQVDDQDYRLEGTEGKGGKAPGWAEIQDGKGAMAIAIRDFWQQWPKSIEASADGLTVGLLPRFKKGDFDHMQPWYKYLYLFEEDRYRLRTGQARRWDIWIDLNGDGASLAKMANAPLIPVPDPAQAIATGVWDSIIPAGRPETAKYDPWAENLFNAYCNCIEVQRDYGAMNWGDWFGERMVNWGNHEYDTTNQLLIQYARTGDPKYFYVADAAARHSSEVDTVHFVNEDLAKHFGIREDFPAGPGLVHQHTVGHVSGFYPPETIRELFVKYNIGNSKTPYLCLDPYNLGHVWTQGVSRHYLLTGDPFLKETVEEIADSIAALVEKRKFRFMGHSHCGRTTGWPLLALAGAYEIGLNDRYLKAMRTLVDDALAEQDPVCGGWLYKLPPGHCNCEKNKHVGMAGFITSVLINGLSRYYLLTGDERLPKAIERAVTFLDNDTWREEWQDWRYTSCPATSRMGQMGVIVMAHVNGVRIADNAEHLRILRVAWDAKFKRLLEAPAPGPGFGKMYTYTMYGCPETVGLLASKESGK